MLEPEVANGQKSILDETSEIVGKSLQEIRTLSKLLNPEIVRNMGLKEAIELEMQRFNRLKFLKAELKIIGTEVDVDKKDEIILFRILQEFLSNSIKHAKTTKLEVTLSFTPENLIITAQDFGVGFDKETIENGSGLINMKSRAKLINTGFSLTSEKDEGVSLILTYPLNQTS